MKHSDTHSAYPDTTTIPSALELGDEWDSEAIHHLIRSHSGNQEMPAFLMLGQKETALLQGHLAKAFGADAVTTLKGTHYMSLEVVELRCERFLATAGRKTVRTLQDPVSRRPAWRDRFLLATPGLAHAGDGGAAKLRVAPRNPSGRR